MERKLESRKIAERNANSYVDWGLGHIMYAPRQGHGVRFKMCVGSERTCNLQMI